MKSGYPYGSWLINICLHKCFKSKVETTFYVYTFYIRNLWGDEGYFQQLNARGRGLGRPSDLLWDQRPPSFPRLRIIFAYNLSSPFTNYPVYTFVDNAFFFCEV